jgi:inorganic triphosphatase YgiF
MSRVIPGMAPEIELKFLCDPADLARAIEAAPRGKAEDEHHRLVSVYFDTPNGDLRRAGVTFRVRSTDGRHIQTLKRGEGFNRLEHEVALPSEKPDLTVAPLADVLSEAERMTLTPTFGVRVLRRQRRVRFNDAEIEIAADTGEAGDEAASTPISELELELKSGAPAALFDLARSLGEAAPLYLSFEGKASQGQAVVDGATLKARRKDKATLSSKATTAEAFQTVARNALTQIAANAQVLRQADRPEAVHQLRVSARRLRAAIAVFKPLVGGARADALKEELRWLARTADQARNLDVLLTESVLPALEDGDGPPGLPRLAAALEDARRAAHTAVAHAVSSARFRTLVLDLAAWIETGAWLSDPDKGLTGLREEPASDFAVAALDIRLRKVRRRARGLAKGSDEARHHLRIEVKKLRYAAEAFEPLFDEARAAKFIDRLKVLQDHLGALNDIVTAEAMLPALHLRSTAAFAAGRIVGQRLAGKARLTAKTVKAFKGLDKAPAFWRA